MRIVVVVFAALITFGLVAFGVVLTQKATDFAGASSSQNTLSAKSDKASLQLGEAVKATAPFASTAVAPNNTMAVAAAGQARNRNGRERRAHGGRRTDRAIFSLSRFAATA